MELVELFAISTSVISFCFFKVGHMMGKRRGKLEGAHFTADYLLKARDEEKKKAGVGFSAAEEAKSNDDKVIKGFSDGTL